MLLHFQFHSEFILSVFLSFHSCAVSLEEMKRGCIMWHQRQRKHQCHEDTSHLPSPKKFKVIYGKSYGNNLLWPPKIVGMCFWSTSRPVERQLIQPVIVPRWIWRLPTADLHQRHHDNAAHIARLKKHNYAQPQV